MNSSTKDPTFTASSDHEFQAGCGDISVPSDQSYIIYLFLSFTFVVLLSQKLRAVFLGRTVNLDLPVLNLVNGDFSAASREWRSNYEYYMKEGYKKYRHSAYQLWGPDGYVVVLSPDFLQELKYEKDEVCDFYSGAANAVQGKVKFLNMTGSVPIHALRSRLTPKLDSLMPTILDELDFAVLHEFPDCSGWTDITIGHILGRVVGRITGRLFFGSSLARDEDWLQTIVDYPENVFTAARKLRQMPAYLRPLALPFLKTIRRSLYIHYKARKTLVPIMEARRASQLNGEEPPEDFLQWVMEGSARETNPTSFGRQAEQHMIIMLAAIHTTTIAGTHMMFDLAAMPHLIEPLRQEINEIWDSCGGALNKSSLRDMVKLDSFMKESQRVNPPAYSTFDRIMTAPKTLSNGLHLPKGTIITIPSSQVSMDPNVWHDKPETFDAFRFSNLRANSDGNTNNFQYPTSTEQSLHFGLGRHACPGRWTSVVENKVILAYIIRHFDIKLCDGTNGRPKNLTFGPNVSPDVSKQISVHRIREHLH